MTLADSLVKMAARGAVEGLERNMDGIVLGVLKALWRNPAYPVIAGGQVRLIEAGIEPEKAWDMSRKCLKLFLEDEGCKVGDPRFGWKPSDGQELVEAYEIEYWEAKP